MQYTGRIMAHRVFFSFRVFNNIKSGSKHTCGERRSPHRQNRNTKFPSFPLIWHTPNAAKDATNTTPIKVAMVTTKLVYEVKGNTLIPCSYIVVPEPFFRKSPDITIDSLIVLEGRHKNPAQRINNKEGQETENKKSRSPLPLRFFFVLIVF